MIFLNFGKIDLYGVFIGISKSEDFFKDGINLRKKMINLCLEIEPWNFIKIKGEIKNFEGKWRAVQKTREI